MISDNAPVIQTTVTIRDLHATRAALYTAITELQDQIDRHWDQSEGGPCGFAQTFDCAIAALAEIARQLEAQEAAQ